MFIFLFFATCGSFGYALAETKAEKAKASPKYESMEVDVLRDGSVKKIIEDELVVGDVIHLQFG